MQNVTVLILGSLFVVFAWPSLNILADVYSVEDDYSHGLLVPFVSLFAAYQIWSEHKTKTPANTSLSGGRLALPGLAFVCIGVIAVSLGQWYYVAMFPDGLGVAFLCAMGLWICILGLSLILDSGNGNLGRFAFPLGYLGFAVPFPKTFTLPITSTLRDIVSPISERVIRALGVIVFREGNLLHLENGTLGIEDACSGIRSFWILISIAAAIGFFVNLGAKRTVVLCLLAVPISVVMNSFRVVSTGFLVNTYGMIFAEGWRHETIGWATFAGGLGAVFLAGQQLTSDRNTEVHDAPFVASDATDLAPAPLGRHPRFRILTSVAASLLFVTGCIGTELIQRHYVTAYDAMSDTRKLLAEFPNRIGDFAKSTDGRMLEQHQKMLSTSDYLIRFYQNDRGDEIELRILYWEPRLIRTEDSWQINPEYFGGSPHFPDLCFPGFGYERLREYDVNTVEQIIPDATSAIRLFKKDGNDFVVLFWGRETYLRTAGNENLDTAANKINTLINSWKTPAVTIGPKYMVNVIVRAETSLNDGKRQAIAFAEKIRTVLPDYGVR